MQDARPRDVTGNQDGLTSHRVAVRRCLKEAPTGGWRTDDTQHPTQSQMGHPLTRLGLCSAKCPRPLWDCPKCTLKTGLVNFFRMLLKRFENYV